jgi:chromosome segregation ATPase
MNIDIDTIINVLTLLLGSGGGAFFTWRYLRQQEAAKAKEAEANAVTAETSAVKEVQDVYQQLITDVKADRDEQKSYISELKEDRRHLREERDELRERQDKLEETVRGLQFEVARNSRIVAFMRPFLCGREGCAIRVPVTISENGVLDKPLPEETKKDIEPLNMKDL